MIVFRKTVLQSLTLALCISTLFLAACRQQSLPPGVTIEAEISPRPATAGPVTVILRIADHGKPLAGARVNLEGDMSHAGMAPVFSDAKENAPGRYQGILQLTMGGDWVVLAHVTLANGQKIERQIDLGSVQPN